MSDQQNVKQLKPGTNGQIITTSGGVATWGNPLATTSVVGEVQLATQTQAFNGSPDTSGGNPLVTQPSGMLVRKALSPSAAIYAMASSNGAGGIAPTNTRGTLALDLQSEIVSVNQIASGLRSITIGQRNEADGNESMSIGQLNTTVGDYSMSIGNNNTNSAPNVRNIIFGASNQLTGAAYIFGSGIFGNSNALATRTSFICGNSNTATGATYGRAEVSVVGIGNNANGANISSVFGRHNTVQGTGTTAVGSGNLLGTSDNACAFGISNTIQVGGSYAVAVGALNSCQASPSTSSAIGVNNLVSNVNNCCIGTGNVIANGVGSENSALGFGNLINASSTAASAVGCRNNVIAGGSYSCAFGRANTATLLTEVFGRSNLSFTGCSYNTIFGFANQVRGSGGSYCTDTSVFGRGNTALEHTLSSSIFGTQNVLNGSGCVAMGNGNVSQFIGQNRVVMMGRANSVLTPNTSDSNVGGSYNTVGNGVLDGSFSNVFGRVNSCGDHSNFFGLTNSFAANGNTNNNNNVFGRGNNSGAGGSTISVTNCECFGTFNELGSINTFGPASVDQGITFGRYNTIVSNQAIAIGSNNFISPGSTKSVLVGWNNTTNGNAANSGAFGISNTLANYTGAGSQSSFAIGNTNTIGILPGGASAQPASNALAVGSLNHANSDNVQMFGYANFSSDPFTTNVRSVIAIGILNNSNANYAVLNDSTGVISGGTPNAYNLAPVGINSIAIGSENLTLGLNSIAIGRHCSATATESVAFGIRCISSASGATALGNRAVSRIPNTLNVGGLPIIRKDNAEGLGTEFISYSGMPAIIQSKIVDLKTAQIYQIALPIGPQFWIDEVGVEVVSANGVTGTPFVSWGTVVNVTYTQKYRQIEQMTRLTAFGNREVFTTFENDVGETSDNVNTVYLAARVEIGATGTTLTGRFYWKGRYVEV